MAALVPFIFFLSYCQLIRPKSDDESSSQPAPPIPIATPLPRAPTDPEFDKAKNATIQNLDTLIQNLNLNTLHQNKFTGQDIKIAILDNGFLGAETLLGKTLPPDAQIINGPGVAQDQTFHGTKLAELIYAVATHSVLYSAAVKGPTLYLLNTNGFTNLEFAVQKAIDLNVDIVVYSQVWEFGGNFDGQGFINQLVNRFTSLGKIWVNAAGNYANATYNTPVITRPDNYLQLPYNQVFLRFQVLQDDNIRIVLSWNDFTNDKNYKTSQDLDFFVENSIQQIVVSGTKKQNPAASADPNFSAHAREIVETSLPAGEYRMRILNNSKNFNAQSKIRVSISGEAVQILDQQKASASVMIPADNPSVLSIGASDDPNSSIDYETSNSFAKPYCAAPSLVQYGDNVKVTGSSTAAALVGAALAVSQSAKKPFNLTTYCRKKPIQLIPTFRIP